MTVRTADDDRFIYAFNEMAERTHQIAVEHGWYAPDDTRTFGDVIALMHSELSEALEEFRAGRGLDEVYYQVPKDDDGTQVLKPEGIATELADVIIRIMDTAAACGIPVAEVIVEKNRFNATRPYRHGGKVI